MQEMTHGNWLILEAFFKITNNPATIAEILFREFSWENHSRTLSRADILGALNLWNFFDDGATTRRRTERYKTNLSFRRIQQFPGKCQYDAD